MDEPLLSVAAVARRLGVAPATLRTWDRRYGLGPADHRPGRHRRYSADDVARLEIMHRALVRGASPADAARHALAAPLPDRGAAPPPEPDPPTEPVPVARDGAGPGARDGAGPDAASARAARAQEPHPVGDRAGSRVLRLPGAGPRARGLGRAALALDAPAARALLVESLDAVGVESTWDDVARPVLGAVADRWAYTGDGIEIEHLLSECVTGVFSAHAARQPQRRGVRPVLLAGMPGERHTLPLAVLAAALADRGIPCRSLGADLPAGALVAAVRRTAPSALVLWSQLAATGDAEVVRTLPRTRPPYRTFAAGPGWRAAELPRSVAHLGSLAAAGTALAAAVLVEAG